MIGEVNPTFNYYEKIKIDNNITGLFLGKEKKNLNYLRSLSDNVILSFISLRDKNYSLVIIKSNNENEYLNVYKQLKMYINNANKQLLVIKEHKKGIKIVKQTQRENAIKKEMAERIEKEIAQKQINLLKQECNNNDNVSDDIYNVTSSSNNPFFGLNVDYD